MTTLHPEEGSGLRWERAAKIFSLTTIPILVALGGWIIQDRLAARNLDREYVALALSIINDSTVVHLELREWAVDLLSDHSPTHLPEAVVDKLKGGTYDLPKTSQPAGVASTEGPEESVSVSVPEGWFTVLGTYPIDDLPLARSEAERLASEIDAAALSVNRQFQIRIYQTRISNDYAVTLGGMWSRSDAISFARAIRDAGLVSDAFAQVNRGWVLTDSLPSGV